MKIYLELNKKHGHGYQVHFVSGPADKVFDMEPFDLSAAMHGATVLIDEVNRQQGTSFKPWEVIQITEEALKANKHDDIQSYHMMKDIESGTHQYSRPAPENKPDVKKDPDGEIAFTGRGVVLFSWFAWLDDKLPKARKACQNYCALLALKGYGGGASEIFKQLEGMDKYSGADWIKATYDRFITDDSTAISYIMQG